MGFYSCAQIFIKYILRTVGKLWPAVFLPSIKNQWHASIQQHLKTYVAELAMGKITTLCYYILA
jgi:hypothetical protein